MQFSSALLPLLEDLRDDMLYYQQASDDRKAGSWQDAVDEDEKEKTRVAFESVLAHVLAIEQRCEMGCVLIPPERCSEANSLFQGQKRAVGVRTRSQILVHRAQLQYQPRWSTEVVVRSDILANSSIMRALARHSA